MRCLALALIQLFSGCCAKYLLCLLVLVVWLCSCSFLRVTLCGSPAVSAVHPLCPVSHSAVSPSP